MKRYYYFLFILFSNSVFVFSQPIKGQWQFNLGIRGKIKLSEKNTGREYSDRGMFMTPSLGLWLSQNALLGVAIPVGTSRQIYTNPENYLFETSTNELRMGVSSFFRYHFLKAKLRPFIHIQPGFAYTRYTSRFINQSSKLFTETKFAAQAGAGLVYFINDKIGVETLVTYAPFRTNYYDKKVQAEVGMQIRFGKKQ